MARRKRKDADDSPIDADYARDVVLNKDPDKRYAFVSVEDLPTMRGRGFVKTERREDGTGPRPAWDVGEATESGFMVGGQLMLMETPEERAVAIQKHAERQFAQQMRGLRDGLAETKANRWGSVGPSPGTMRTEFRVET